MNKYIFLTNEGYTIPVNEDKQVENAQLIGIAEGKNEKEAFENLKQEYDYLKELGFEEIYCLKLDNNYDKNIKFFVL